MKLRAECPCGSDKFSAGIVSDLIGSQGVNEFLELWPLVHQLGSRVIIFQMLALMLNTGGKFAFTDKNDLSVFREQYVDTLTTLHDQMERIKTRAAEAAMSLCTGKNLRDQPETHQRWYHSFQVANDSKGHFEGHMDSCSTHLNNLISHAENTTGEDVDCELLQQQTLFRRALGIREAVVEGAVAEGHLTRPRAFSRMQQHMHQHKDALDALCRTLQLCPDSLKRDDALDYTAAVLCAVTSMETQMRDYEAEGRTSAMSQLNVKASGMCVRAVIVNDLSRQGNYPVDSPDSATVSAYLNKFDANGEQSQALMRRMVPIHGCTCNTKASLGGQIESLKFRLETSTPAGHSLLDIPVLTTIPFAASSPQYLHKLMELFKQSSGLVRRAREDGISFGQESCNQNSVQLHKITLMGLVMQQLRFAPVLRSMLNLTPEHLDPEGRTLMQQFLVHRALNSFKRNHWDRMTPSNQLLFLNDSKPLPHRFRTVSGWRETIKSEHTGGFSPLTPPLAPCRQSGTIHIVPSNMFQLPQSNWAADSDHSSCCGCQAEFGICTRRHHCRWCGKIYCACCSGKTMRLKNEVTVANPKRLRVCDRCHSAFVLGSLSSPDRVELVHRGNPLQTDEAVDRCCTLL